MPNRLKNETSPYLLQHAHNPVDWYAWGEEALQRAKREDKPILVSIGYSACHWCHVMERESFEDEETAKIMNAHFVNIKIDREERPDLDHIYMDAVQAMTGSGGWPLNVFLTPSAKPFYGGTYFPPVRMHNRPSWKETLAGVAQTYKEKRTEVETQADYLTNHIEQSAMFGAAGETTENLFDTEKLHDMFVHIMQVADRQEGGFGNAPKFPQTFSIQYLLRYYHFFKDEDALSQARLSLDKMIRGGIYDQAGGGFARYSTDAEWLAPHFEKMLYDNALLLIVMSEAYQLTHQEIYRRGITQTMQFIEREMLSTEKGFYSALDADSEGEEGKYYVWTKAEVDIILENDAPLFCACFDVSEKGNWEGTNILRLVVDLESFALQHNIDATELQYKLDDCLGKLLLQRNKRVRPLLDDKMLLGWNALMNTACCKAYAATGEKRYRQLAIDNMEFVLQRFTDKDAFFHTYKNGIARYPAFLDDYAFLIQSLIHLQEVTGNGDYLLRARKLAGYVTDNFCDTETGFFYFTHKDQPDIIVRKKEVYDGAIPSGNATMAGNLQYLSHVFDNSSWREHADDLMATMSPVMLRHPNSFGVWANLFMERVKGMKELVVTGENFDAVHFDILHNFMPARILQLSSYPVEDFPLLAGKEFTYPHLIFLCENYVCRPPVTSLSGLIQQLENDNPR
jgi:uncharacterized protein